MAYNNDMIAEIVNRVMSELGGTNQKEDNTVPVGVSIRHIHLSVDDAETLFGKGYQLTPLKDLSQPGQFACKET